MRSNDIQVTIDTDGKVLATGKGCTVKVIADTVNPYNGRRITTLQMRYWRAIHAEFMTHRVFSRNASSSRAIPISTFLKQVWSEPAGPIHWGKNQAGMKAREELTGISKWIAQTAWTFAGKLMCGVVWSVNKLVSPHKQTFNRLLEPWQYISVIVTTTEWDNWDHLRDHKDAQPEIQDLARTAKAARGASIPCKRDYHLPYVLQEEIEQHPIDTLMKLSTARCARVSYLTHEGKKPTIENDLKLYKQLVESVPIHASPTEHPCIVSYNDAFTKNHRGWIQHRVNVEGREIKEVK